MTLQKQNNDVSCGLAELLMIKMDIFGHASPQGSPWKIHYTNENIILSAKMLPSFLFKCPLGCFSKTICEL